MAEALHAFTQIAEGVAAAHEHPEKVIHRDLKPANVMIIERAGKNHATILDFGVAKFSDQGRTTNRNLAIGTPLYMAPEQLQGNGVTFASDIYSVGVMLYEALLGRQPFKTEEGYQNVQQLALAHYRRDRQLISDLDPTIPRSVAKIVDRAMRVLPPERFASMRDFARALQSAGEELARQCPDVSQRALWRPMPTARIADLLVPRAAARAERDAVAQENAPPTMQEVIPEADPTEPDFRPSFAAEADDGAELQDVSALPEDTDPFVESPLAGTAEGTWPGIGTPVAQPAEPASDVPLSEPAPSKSIQPFQVSFRSAGLQTPVSGTHVITPARRVPTTASSPELVPVPASSDPSETALPAPPSKPHAESARPAPAASGPRRESHAPGSELARAEPHGSPESRSSPPRPERHHLLRAAWMTGLLGGLAFGVPVGAGAGGALLVYRHSRAAENAPSPRLSSPVPSSSVAERAAPRAALPSSAPPPIALPAAAPATMKPTAARAALTAAPALTSQPSASATARVNPPVRKKKRAPEKVDRPLLWFAPEDGPEENRKQRDVAW